MSDAESNKTGTGGSRVLYKKKMVSLGLNGPFIQAGINVQAAPARDRIFLDPLNSRLKIGKASMEIPVEDVPRLIEALQEQMNMLQSEVA